MSRNHARIPWRARERVRKMALDRDVWRCTTCESPADLEVHHIRPLAEGGSALALGNVRTLCRDCHIEEHLSSDRRAWRRLLAEGV